MFLIEDASVTWAKNGVRIVLLNESISQIHATWSILVVGKIIHNGSFMLRSRGKSKQQMTAIWTNNEELFPTVTDEMIYNYCSMKKQGNLGQQEKACRMLQSRVSK